MTDQLEYRKSSYSGGDGGGGNCVEVAVTADGGRSVRHSKDPEGLALLFTASEWTAFTAGVCDGEFN